MDFQTAVREQSRKPDKKRDTFLSRLSIRAALADLMIEKRTGHVREVYDQAIAEGWRPAMGNSIFWPYQSMRALTASSNPQLVSTQVNFDAATALLGTLWGGKLGVTVLDAPYGANVALPKLTGAGTGYVVSSETSQVTASGQSFGQVAFTPRTIGTYSELSRLLMLQASQAADNLVATSLLQAHGRERESRMAFGAGSGGDLTGLVNQSGVTSWSLSSFNLATAMQAVTNAGDALDGNFGYLAARAAAITLRQRQELTNSSVTLWQGSPLAGTLAGFPAVSSTNVTANYAFAGPWGYAVLASWGGGVEVSLNPYGQPSTDGNGNTTNPNFQKGIYGIRTLETLDFQLVWPSAFSVSGASFS